ncbi:hypothetical protein CIB48_g6412 [Xylaria polymorpha]|nr:hypothetical protein CIB48_g6412 [Xylaria polymorpha]
MNFAPRFVSMALLDNSQDIKSWVPGEQILALALFAGLVYYILSPRKTIYDEFPKVSDNVIRSIFWPTHIQKLVWKGYQNITKPTNRPFTVRWWAKEFLILPPERLSALRDADWVHLSFFRTISDISSSSTKGAESSATPIVEKEIGYALKAELGESPAGRIMGARDFFTAIVHRAACRILVGEELCRDEDFIRESTAFVISIFITALIIVKLPLGPMRNWLAYPISIWHRRKLNRCTKMILPVLTDRIAEHSSQGGLQESRLDAIELLLLEPQYKEPLLKEAVEALGDDNRWTEKALGRLPLLDSFIRETNRLNPTGSITCSRTVLERPIVFPDGLTLPVGTRFGFPTEAMQNDADGSFEGFRFAKFQSFGEESEASASAASTTVSPSNLAFGYGTHACPGRFFAIRMVKMVVITVLLNYEIEWEGEVNCRPEPMWIEGQYIPNGSQKRDYRGKARNNEW